MIKNFENQALNEKINSFVEELKHEQIDSNLKMKVQFTSS